jgi:hypothetical protein
VDRGRNDFEIKKGGNSRLEREYRLEQPSADERSNDQKLGGPITTLEEGATATTRKIVFYSEEATTNHLDGEGAARGLDRSISV